MKHLITLCLFVYVCFQAAILWPQSPEERGPKYTIALAEYRHDSRGPGIHRVSITLVNTSGSPLHLEGCAVQRGLYTFTIFFNGHPLQETDAMARHTSEAKNRGLICTSDSTANLLKPGEVHRDIVTIPSTYDMSSPGNYEITVSRRDSSDHRGESTNVKSNTLVIVVQ